MGAVCSFIIHELNPEQEKAVPVLLLLAQRGSWIEKPEYAVVLPEVDIELFVQP